MNQNFAEIDVIEPFQNRYRKAFLSLGWACCANELALKQRREERSEYVGTTEERQIAELGLTKYMEMRPGADAAKLSVPELQNPG